MAPKCRRVAVVGAGVAGLAAVKSCLEEGLEVTGYDSRPVIGGLWSDTETQTTNPSGPSMYSTLVTNVSKAIMCFSDFPCPAHFPPYMPYWRFQEYLELYVDHFGLHKHYQLNTKVVRVTKTADHDVTGRWSLQLMTSSGECTEEVFDGVIVCTGFFSKAKTLEVKGLKDKFKGRVIHSRDYKTNDSYVGRTVLVVGNANSAADIACDVSNVAKQVYMSVGSGMVLSGRTHPSCLPPDLGIVRILMEMFRQETIFKIIHFIANRKFNHKNCGLKYTGTGPAIDCPLTVCDDLPVRLMSGKVKVIPYVTEYGETDIVTNTGVTYSGVDDVIAAIGYDQDLSVLDPSLGLPRDGKMDLYKQIFPISWKHHTLALVGCQRSVGPIVSLLELQARLAAYTLSGTHKLPAIDVMKADADTCTAMAARPNGTYKYWFFSPLLADSVAEELGVKPRFWDMVLAGKPRLAFKCYFGPYLSCHYRLFGHKRWEGAEEAMDRVVAECLPPLQARKPDCEMGAKQTNSTIFMFVFGLVLILIFLQFFVFRII